MITIVISSLIAVFADVYVYVFLGIVYLITIWCTQEQRSLRLAFVLASASLAGAFEGASDTVSAS